jgi:hypothetical protein
MEAGVSRFREKNPECLPGPMNLHGCNDKEYWPFSIFSMAVQEVMYRPHHPSAWLEAGCHGAHDFNG